MKAINTTHLIKPTTSSPHLSTLLNSAAISTISLGSLMDRPRNYTNKISNSSNDKSPKEITLLHFMRLYKVGNIPIIDFVVVYLMLCVLNHLYFHLDYKIILISAIPFTIIFNLLADPNCKLSQSTLIVLAASIGYVVWSWLTTLHSPN